MKKKINLNRDFKYLINIVIYICLIFAVLLLLYGINLQFKEMMVLILGEALYLQFDKFIRFSMFVVQITVLSLLISFGTTFVTNMLYIRYVKKNEWLEIVKFFNVCVRIKSHMKIAFRRVKMDVDEKYPLIYIEKIENMYIVTCIKNHWFTLEQIQKNTDFFKSVIKLPVYKIIENYDQIDIYFAIKDTVMKYQEFTKFFNDENVVIGYNENDEPVYWNYNKIPHLLGIGVTGSGKSNFMHVLVDSLISIGAQMRFLDGKRVEMLQYRQMGYDVFTEQFVYVVRDFHKMMTKRYVRMEKSEVNDYRLLKPAPKPYFMLIDEFGSILINLKKTAEKGERETEQKEVIRLLIDILRLGRAAGVQLIVFTQDAKAESIDTSMRNNFNLRMILGFVKEKTAYDMMFGSEYRNMERLEVGKGYYMADGEPQVFKIPEYKKLMNLVK